MPSVERSLTPRARVPLAPFSTLGIGGEARWFVRAGTIEDIAAAHRWSVEHNAPLFVLGGGSNLVIADEGIDGLVLHVALSGIEFTRSGDDTIIRAQAGESWDGTVEAAVSRGLAGFECLSGIPGSVGGTPIQNVGAYGQDVSETLEEVTTFDRQTGRIVTMTAKECQFGYRTSCFKREDAGRFIVCAVVFRLRPGVPTTTYPDVIGYLERHDISLATVADVRQAVLAIRRGKGMVLDEADPDTRSVGSFFMNPVVDARVHAGIAASFSGGHVPGFVVPSGDVKIPAAWLIEHSGFSRGHQHGRAGLSSRHPLALINRGGASAREVVDLAIRIKRQVADRFGIWLRPEPVFVGFGDDPDVEFLLNARGG